MDAGLMVENNYFDTVNNPGRVDFSGDLGRLVSRGNILVNVRGSARSDSVPPISLESQPPPQAARLPVPGRWVKR
jgi:pectate lyase